MGSEQAAHRITPISPILLSPSVVNLQHHFAQSYMLKPLTLWITVLLTSIGSGSLARTLEIGPGKPFANINAAALEARPGDTIAFASGIHSGGAHVTDLQGTADKWIVIRGDSAMTAIIRGGSNAIQFTDAAYVRIEGLVFEEQTGNGVNMDDGGTYETPSHNVIIDGCEWRSMDATGNNDMLKMSGIDDFLVMNCRFSNGAAGGSLIDMVGCHLGEFADNVFQNAGSNCIQAKGGTSEIAIYRNTFLNGGQRAINIGGSTGLEFFRPLGVTYEARNINVWSNIIKGGVASVAFVGAIDSKVINNTIIEPERWAVRILQESVDGFQQCGNNSFVNNIVVTSSTQPAVNIGPNTAPETFTFSHNLWFNPSNSAWSGPNTPVNEPGRILGQDPLFADSEYHLTANSPARAAGNKVVAPVLDHYGRPFADPRSIGAVEYASGSVVSRPAIEATAAVYPNPVSSVFKLNIEATELTIVDVLGRVVWQGSYSAGESIDATSWAPGYYSLRAGDRALLFLKH